MHRVKMGAPVGAADCATWWAQGRSVKNMMFVLHSGQQESRGEGKENVEQQGLFMEL